jgi:putative endonuclease
VIRAPARHTVAGMSRIAVGRLGEQLAAEHFERLGWVIVARNFRTRHGELDLVASVGEVLVFAEVKTCRVGRGDPWTNLHEGKQAQVRQMASAWLSLVRDRPRFAAIRFDAIGVLVDDADQLVRLDHLEGAF